jgi:hypothetical protein
MQILQVVRTRAADANARLQASGIGRGLRAVWRVCDGRVNGFHAAKCGSRSANLLL